MYRSFELRRSTTHPVAIAQANLSFSAELHANPSQGAYLAMFRMEKGPDQPSAEMAAQGDTGKAAQSMSRRGDESGKPIPVPSSLRSWPLELEELGIKVPTAPTPLDNPPGPLGRSVVCVASSATPGRPGA